MKILISTFGIRGDVQPYIALGVGLQAAGHTVARARYLTKLNGSTIAEAAIQSAGN